MKQPWENKDCVSVCLPETCNHLLQRRAASQTQRERQSGIHETIIIDRSGMHYRADCLPVLIAGGFQREYTLQMTTLFIDERGSKTERSMHR